MLLDLRLVVALDEAQGYAVLKHEKSGARKFYNSCSERGTKNGLPFTYGSSPGCNVIRSNVEQRAEQFRAVSVCIRQSDSAASKLESAATFLFSSTSDRQLNFTNAGVRDLLLSGVSQNVFRN